MFTFRSVKIRQKINFHGTDFFEPPGTVHQMTWYCRDLYIESEELVF